MRISNRVKSHIAKVARPIPEPMSTVVFKRLISRYDCFIDIGAQLGHHAVTAHQLKPSVGILIIEADNEQQKILKKNLRRVRAQHQFIAAGNLDELTQQSKKWRKCFVKLSFRGRETKVLELLPELLQKKPTMLLTLNQLDATGIESVTQLIFDQLLHQNYCCYSLNELSYEFVELKPKSRKWFGQHYHPMLSVLCVPTQQQMRIGILLKRILAEHYLKNGSSRQRSTADTVRHEVVTAKLRNSALKRTHRQLSQRFMEITASDYFRVWQWIANLSRLIKK